MKTTRPIYIFNGPVTAIAIVVLLAGNIFFYLKGSRDKADYQANLMLLGHTHRPDQLPKADTAATYPDGFETDDRAVFKFTGDTVLVLAPAALINANPAWNVLYKDHHGIYQTEDLPEDMLDKIKTDTSRADSSKITRDKRSSYR